MWSLRSTLKVIPRLILDWLASGTQSPVRATVQVTVCKCLDRAPLVPVTTCIPIHTRILSAMDGTKGGQLLLMASLAYKQRVTMWVSVRATWKLLITASLTGPRQIPSILWHLVSSKHHLHLKAHFYLIKVTTKTRGLRVVFSQTLDKILSINKHSQATTNHKELWTEGSFSQSKTALPLNRLWKTSKGASQTWFQVLLIPNNSFSNLDLLGKTNKFPAFTTVGLAMQSKGKGINHQGFTNKVSIVLCCRVACRSDRSKQVVQTRFKTLVTDRTSYKLRALGLNGVESASQGSK